MYFCNRASNTPPPKRKLPYFYGFFLFALREVFLIFLFVRYLHSVELRCISALQMATENVPEEVKCNKKYSLYLHGMTIHK